MLTGRTGPTPKSPRRCPVEQKPENVRPRLVTEGLDAVLNRKKRETSPRRKILDGKQEAEIIALRLGKPPSGFANWTLRLLADQIVKLEIADSISYETVRRTLKKRAHSGNG
jgi:hypothetical protein